MKKWIVAMLASLLAANLALAEVRSPPVPCDAQMRDKSLSAETRSRISSRCGKIHARIDTHVACLNSADKRKLRGNERANFLQKCSGNKVAGTSPR